MASTRDPSDPPSPPRSFKERLRQNHGLVGRRAQAAAAMGRPVDNPPPIVEPTVPAPAGPPPAISVPVAPLPDLSLPAAAPAAVRGAPIGTAAPRRERHSARAEFASDARAPRPGFLSALARPPVEVPERPRRARAADRVPESPPLHRARHGSGERGALGGRARADGRLPGLFRHDGGAAPRRRGRWTLGVLAGGLLGVLIGGSATLVSLGLAGTGAMLTGIPAALRTLVAHRAADAGTATGAVPTDPARRAAYYRVRAEAGADEAQLQLAILFAKGSGVKQDYATAATWFRAAARQGLARAQYDLAVLYQSGRGVPVDIQKALGWYRKAADGDYALAQYNLAVALSKGDGTPQDFIEAALWYRRAALAGVVPAMLNLAILYERGDGVAGSTIDAYAWYRAAAEGGNAEAQQKADELMAAFSPADQSSAEAKAAEIGARIHAGPRSDEADEPSAGPPAAASTAESPVMVTGIATQH